MGKAKDSSIHVLNMADKASCMALGQALSDMQVEVDILTQGLVEEGVAVGSHSINNLSVLALQNASKNYMLPVQVRLAESKNQKSKFFNSAFL